MPTPDGSMTVGRGYSSGSLGSYPCVPACPGAGGGSLGRGAGESWRICSTGSHSSTASTEPRRAAGGTREAGQIFGRFTAYTDFASWVVPWRTHLRDKDRHEHRRQFPESHRRVLRLPAQPARLPRHPADRLHRRQGRLGGGPQAFCRRSDSTGTCTSRMPTSTSTASCRGPARATASPGWCSG